MVTVTASRVMDLDEMPGWDVSGVSVGPASDPLVLLWERPPDLPTDPLEAKFPGITTLRRRVAGPNRFRVLHRRDDAPIVLDVPKTSRDYHFAQPLPGGEYLLVGARTDAAGNPNADVYAADGRLLRSFLVGGGILHLLATAGGRVWAGYDDVATQGPGLGRHGAACFDSAGRLLLGYNDLADAQGIEDVFDCYAMNVVSDAEVWLFYYVDFPLVRLVDGRISGHWPALGQTAPIAGSDAFAVAGDRVLFRGGYHDRDRLYLVPLDGRPAQEVVPVDEGGVSIATVWAFGRGSRLYLWTGRTLFGLDAASLAGP